MTAQLLESKWTQTVELATKVRTIICITVVYIGNFHVNLDHSHTCRFQRTHWQFTLQSKTHILCKSTQMTVTVCATAIYLKLLTCMCDGYHGKQLLPSCGYHDYWRICQLFSYTSVLPLHSYTQSAQLFTLFIRSLQKWDLTTMDCWSF